MFFYIFAQSYFENPSLIFFNQLLYRIINYTINNLSKNRVWVSKSEFGMLIEIIKKNKFNSLVLKQKPQKVKF